MLYVKHVPAKPLSELVEYLWLLSDVPGHATERILPTGTVELVINLRDDAIQVLPDPRGWRRLSGIVLSGPYQRPFTIDASAHTLVMGAHFRPAGAAPFTRVALGELSDVHVDARELWGARAEELRERLRRAETHEQRFSLLEDALRPYALTECSRPSGVRFAIDSFERGTASVHELVAQVGLSHRHFVKVFHEHVGMTPKSFSRVRRFQRAVTAASRGTSLDWAALAVACGYCDQSHLIRDFTEFAGMPPTEWKRRSLLVKDHHVVARGQLRPIHGA